MALIPQFGGLIWTLLAFVIALSVIVAIHEYGHYIVGRWSGIHADVFSLGFGPVIYSRYDKRGTKWQIAALPFGGYVKFAGDADAASGKDVAAMEAAEADPKRLRATMHGAPLWARAATVAAGPVFNFALSILVFAAIGLSDGVPRDPMTVGEMHPLPFEQNELVEPLLNCIDDRQLQFHGQLASLPKSQRRQRFVSSRAVLYDNSHSS